MHLKDHSDLNLWLWLWFIAAMYQFSIVNEYSTTLFILLAQKISSPHPFVRNQQWKHQTNAKYVQS